MLPGRPGGAGLHIFVVKGLGRFLTIEYTIPRVLLDACRRGPSFKKILFQFLEEPKNISVTH